MPVVCIESSSTWRRKNSQNLNFVTNTKRVLCIEWRTFECVDFDDSVAIDKLIAKTVID